MIYNIKIDLVICGLNDVKFYKPPSQSSHSISQWFKFELKPPIGIMTSKLLLDIWDTSILEFVVIFGHGDLKTCPRSLCGNI